MSRFRILSTHVSMDVANLEQAQSYLEETLGIDRLRRLDRPDGSTIVLYPGLELSQGDSNSTLGHAKHVAWQVDDIQEAIRSLKEEGFLFENEQPRVVDASYLDTKEIIY